MGGGVGVMGEWVWWGRSEYGGGRSGGRSGGSGVSDVNRSGESGEL